MDDFTDGTMSPKWAPPSRGKMRRIYEERDALRAENARLRSDKASMHELRRRLEALRAEHVQALAEIARLKGDHG